MKRWGVTVFIVFIGAFFVTGNGSAENKVVYFVFFRGYLEVSGDARYVKPLNYL